MKLSVMSYTLARLKRNEEFDLVRMCEFTRELGLDGIDMISTYGRHPREIRRLLDDFGLKAVCHAFFASLNHADATERQPGLDAIRRGIDNALTIGADKIMVVTPGNDDCPRDENRGNCIAGLKKAAPWAREAGLALTIENFPGFSSPFVTAGDFHLAKKEIPDLKLTFDDGNAGIGENAAESFRRCAADVVHAHFKDWDLADDGILGLDGRRYRTALIGEGIMDHEAVLAEMKQAGYTGYITIEYEGDKYEPEAATRRAAAYLTGLIAGLP